MCFDGSCPTGYTFDSVSIQCVEICGDGQRVSMECDDGNVVSGDGCSEICQVEADYTCQGPLSQPSLCSYNKPLEIILVDTIKDMNSNKV